MGLIVSPLPEGTSAEDIAASLTEVEEERMVSGRPPLRDHGTRR